MSIAKDATEIKRHAERLTSLKNETSAASDLGTIARELELLVEGTVMPTKIVHSLSNALTRNNPERNVTPVPTAPPLAQNKLKSALDCVTKHRSDFARINQIEWQAIRFAFQAFGQALRDRMHSDWGALCDQEYIPWADDLVSRLEFLGFGEELKLVQVTAKEISKFRAKLPDSVSDIEQFQKLAVKYRGATEKVGLPGFMKEFLQSAGNGAPLESLTPEVIEWLKEKGLMDRFAVKFASQRR